MRLSQVQNALKRGVAYGILKKTDGHYSLPTDNEIARQEVATQELGMLDLYCQRKVHRSKGGRARRNRDAGCNRRVACRCSRGDTRRRSPECGSRSCGRRRKGKYERGGFDGRVHDETMKIEPISDADKLTDKLNGTTELNRTTTGDGVIGGIEQSNRPSMSTEQWDGIPLSC